VGGSELNIHYVTVQYCLTGIYKWDGVCLLRGTLCILRSAHTVYLCVLCGSENKQRLFHCTALTDWLVFVTDGVCLLRGTFYILRSAHTVYLCVLCGSEKKTAIISLYSIGLLVL